MENLTFHADEYGRGGIPAGDALIAIYASYYMGSQDHEEKSHLNAHFNLRAKNAFNMGAAMEHAFGRPDSPWIVLDHLSDKRRDAQNTDKPLHGAHFLALYHRDTGRVMITMPGLESDDNPGDTLMDLKEMTFGGMRGQSKALYDYTKETERKINDGGFKGPDGSALPVHGGIIIGAHSMGCTAAQMMALDGYKTVLVEPRPVHDGLLRRIASNLAHITGGKKMGEDEAAEKLDASAVNIRSLHANVWNSLVLPWARSRALGQNFAYSTAGHEVKPADRGLGTFHRIEMSAPSLNGIREAKGFEEGAFLTPVSRRDDLVADILNNNRKKNAKPHTP